MRRQSSTWCWPGSVLRLAYALRCGWPDGKKVGTMPAPSSDVIEKMRKLWVDAGYPAIMGSAFVAPPPSSKFKRLYHLISAEHAISNIAFCRLKVALLNHLNDPFELQAAKLINNRELRISVHEFRDRLAPKVGLLCFSEDWVDPVLWTHYASRHSGICLGFDVPTELVMKVNYQDDRIQLSGGSLDDKLQAALLSTKYSSWRYEREWRMQVDLSSAEKEGSLYFEEIGRRIHLAEVILGVNCVASVGAVRKLVDEHHENVVTFQARLAIGSFAIVPKEMTISANPPFAHVR